MTTKDKAKAYDEVIRKAAALYKVSEPMSGCNVILETLFPELSESEDEKVRKILFEFFKNYKEQDTCGSETFNGIPTDNILAWLEKQGKPSDEEMKTLLRTEYEKGRADAIAEMQGEWSEEDEETLGWLCTFLKGYGHEFYEGNEENDVIDWLKSLRPQNRWKPSDE